MKKTKEQVLADLRGLFGEARVITEENAVMNYDGDNNVYAKAFGAFLSPQPMCILNVCSTGEVAKALAYCNENGVGVIPRTGASSYELLLTAVDGDCIVIDASGMKEIIKIDYDNMMATCQCGVPLIALEELLQAQGYTTGHSPQSQPLAQMGGLVATRSIGQFSTYYGGIEDMLCGLEAVLPDGKVVQIRNVPRRAAGPDLRHLFLGCEGALAFVTEVTVKIFRYYPEDMWLGGYVMKSFGEGLEACREIITAGYKPSVVRLYDKPDFDYNFGSIELNEGEAFMFFTAEGPGEVARAMGSGIDRIARERGGRYVGIEAVAHWLKHRNDRCAIFGTEKRREGYRQKKTFYATTEISASWTDIQEIYKNVMERLPREIDNLTVFGGHVSHSYQNGTNIYFVYEFKVSSPEAYLGEHRRIIDAICDEVLKLPTGSCVHHHSMGKMRLHLAEREHGNSYELIRSLKEMMDPNGIMNPGALVAKK